jgi:tRNA-specific 2-thiouridylase
MTKNEVYVTTDLQDEHLWHNKIKLTDLHWINKVPESGKTYSVRTRYRADLVACRIDGTSLQLQQLVRAVTPGQSAVLYDGNRVLGGGIVI